MSVGNAEHTNEKNTEKKTGKHSFSLFSEGIKKGSQISRSQIDRHRSFWGASNSKYTLDNLEAILASNDIIRKRNLSREFFDKNGFYKQIIMHYGTLLMNVGILTPNLPFGKSLQDDKDYSKRYLRSLDLIENLKLKELLTRISLSTLIDGVYYGLLYSIKRNEYVVIDLPFEYCRSQYKDLKGKGIIEFNLQYFNFEYKDKKEREAALRSYPVYVQKAYERWNKGSGENMWFFLPTEDTVFFQLHTPQPYFLSLIPVTVQYDQAVEKESEKAAEEIKKLIIQKIPHLSDGELLFEPDEAAEIHSATAGMLSESNPNTSVITTYGDIEVAQSRTTDSVTHTMLNQMGSHLYSNAGVSSQLFSGSTSSSSLELSLEYDTGVMMVLENQYSGFLTDLVNRVNGTQQVSFKYELLPVTLYNQEKYVTRALKLAQFGYSFLIAAVAQGLSQRDFVNLKRMENDYLGLHDVLRPLQSSHTGSGNEQGEDTGRPSEESPSDKTEQNKDSL